MDDDKNVYMMIKGYCLFPKDFCSCHRSRYNPPHLLSSHSKTSACPKIGLNKYLSKGWFKYLSRVSQEEMQDLETSTFIPQQEVPVPALEEGINVGFSDRHISILVSHDKIYLWKCIELTGLLSRRCPAMVKPGAITWISQKILFVFSNTMFLPAWCYPCAIVFVWHLRNVGKWQLPTRNFPARARSAGPKGLYAESARAVTGRECL